jgi:hypothetical protein
MEGGVKTKRHVVSLDIFNHYFRWQDIAIINDVELNSYADGTDYHFQDGTLLKGSGPEIYAISYGKKRHITSADAYLARGYAWGQSILVSAEELNSYITGNDLN